MTPEATLLSDFPLALRIGIFIGVAVVTHVVVLLVRNASKMILHNERTRRYRKLRSIGTLTASTFIFTLYFIALGLILRDVFDVNMTAYLASASVIGLAVGFGSQGVVQDVVTGLTFIFSDLVDVGDLVEISGQTGIVRGITMRFVELQNAMGASVFIPNRTISNVINYPRGYVRCIVDVTLTGDGTARDKAAAIATTLMGAAEQQFAGILVTEPSSEGRMTFSSGKEILRLKFRIWPGRGAPIENSFVKELTAEMERLDVNFEPWMVSVGYEVEKRALARPKSLFQR